jgi:SNF2 family DNA or RNA helicase
MVDELSVKQVGQELHVKSPFAMTAICQAVGEGTWDGELRMWKYDCTASKAKQILDAFGPRLEADDRVRELAETLADDSHPLQIDESPIGEPFTKSWPHQYAGVRAIEQFPALYIRGGMGVGKSKIIVDAVKHYGMKRVLIVCPNSVLDVWPTQFGRHWPEFEGHVHSTEAENKTVERRSTEASYFLKDVSPAAVVVNYEAAWRPPFLELIAAFVPWDMIVCDEIHMIKAHGGVTSKKLFQFAAPYADRRVGLSGTQCPHSPLDIFGQFRFLDVNIFGKWWTHFRDRYAIMGRITNQFNKPVNVIGYQNTTELRRKINSITLDIRREDVLDLPESMDVERYVTLSKAGQKVYNDLDDYFVAEVEQGLVTVANAMVKVTKLQQATSGFVRVDKEDMDPELLRARGDAVLDVSTDDTKEKLLIEILEEIEPHEAVVVFSRFHYDLSATHRAAEATGRPSYELSGRDGGKKEQHKWSESARAGDGPVLAAQAEAGALGIDLTAAHYAVYYSLSLDRGKYDQSKARLHRPGQKNKVTNVHLLVRGSVDEKIYRGYGEGRDAVNFILDGILKKKGER